MNIKKILSIAGLFAAWVLPMSGAIPEGYYTGLEGKYGIDLRDAAKTAGKKGYHRITYSSGTWEAFEKTDVKIVNGREAWWDMYSNDIVYLPGHSGLNIEHSVAQSWWGGGHSNDQGCDLFHLNPSESDANNRKANYPLGEISGTPTWTNGVTNVGNPVSGQGGGSSKVYEPADEYKGDFARAFMYIFTVYNNISWAENTAWMYSTTNMLLFKPWAVELLIRWSNEDPVDDKERNRNEEIYKIQGNRNPFIDMPELADYIWGSKNTIPFQIGGSTVEPNPNPNPDPNPNPVEPGTEILTCDFESMSIPGNGWTNEVTSGSLSGWYIKSYQNNNYAAASAYKGTESGGPYEFWLVSPKMSIPEGQEGILTFRTQGAYGVSDCTMDVWKLTDPSQVNGGGEKLEAAICTPNANGASPVYCDWVSSGNVEIGSGDCYVAFRYYSARGGNNNSATYCLDDVKVVTKASSSVAEIEEDAIKVVNGEIVAPEGSRIYDLTGMEVIATQPGKVYIVVTPTGGSRKIISK